MRRATFLALVFLVVPAGSAAAETAQQGTAPAPDLPEGAREGVARCAKCHVRVVQEWRASMHSRSTAEGDPVHRVVRDQAVEAIGEKAQKCKSCHEPPWAPAARAAGAPVEGVSCVACHRIAAGHPKERLPDGSRSAFAAGTGVRGGSDGAGGLCLTCHAENKNPEGYPVCTTADETVAGGGRPCTDCHMPARTAADGKPLKGRSHRVPGAWDRDFLRTAATLGLAFDRGPDGPRARVTVTASGTGHALPTGQPMRAVVLRVEALGADGAVLWRNAGADALADDPDAVFQRVFRDAEGKGPVPPFRAKGPSTDTRIPGGASRERTYALPAGTREVRARLEFVPGPAPLLRKAGLSEEAIAPTIIAERREVVP